MDNGRIDGAERDINVLFARLTALEAAVALLGQTLWQLSSAPEGGTSGSTIKYATGTVPAKAAGVLGSATVNLFDLDASTGVLTAAGTGTAWNDGAHATANDLIVEADANGNLLIIAEFCP